VCVCVCLCVCVSSGVRRMLCFNLNSHSQTVHTMEFYLGETSRHVCMLKQVLFGSRNDMLCIQYCGRKDWSVSNLYVHYPPSWFDGGHLIKCPNERVSSISVYHVLCVPCSRQTTNSIKGTTLLMCSVFEADN